MKRVLTLTICLLAGAWACTSTSSGPGPDDPDDPNPGDLPELEPAVPEVAYLSPEDHLTRASMALRGIRPSLAELEEVAADPSAIEAIVDEYLESPQFGVTMRELHNATLLTRSLTLPGIDDLSSFTGARINASVGDEPLRLIQYVIENDRPYTEIVTADYTVADAVVARAYGLPYDAAAGGWQVTHYQDGRPEAGILSATSIFLRHRSAGANWHRGRANQLSNALLCYNFLDRDVTLDGSIDLSDPEVVRDAVRANPACASCHQTLDPLASFFWGYRPNVNVGQLDAYPIADMYDPAREGRWRNTSQRPPGFFGLAADDIGGLGDLIADDPRFSFCAAERFYSYMAQVEPADIPLGLTSELQSVLIDSGYSAKQLAKAIVLSDEFRASYAHGADAAEYIVGIKKARPGQLERMFTDLTGFRWETNSTVRVRGTELGRVGLLDNDVVGFRVLAGGIDSEFVIEPSHTFNATSSLVLRAIAAEAAGFVVDRDLAEPDADARKLLVHVTADDRDEAAVRAQIAYLHARLYGELIGPDDDEVTATYELFAATLARTDDVAHAWKTTLTAMLQDVRIATF